MQKQMNEEKNDDKVEELSDSAFFILKHSHYTKKKHNLSLTAKKHSFSSIKHKELQKMKNKKNSKNIESTNI
jgi:hypothetical protein